MVGAVVQLGVQADHRVTGEHAFADILAQALFHGRDEVARHHAAHDRVLKLELDIRIADRAKTRSTRRRTGRGRRTASCGGPAP